MHHSKRYKRKIRGKKLMRKIVISVLILMMTVFSGSAFANSINKAISDSGINKSAISISIKDTSTGATVYELNSKTPTPPASTLKLVTFTTALNTLGDNYEFKTGLYKGLNNELYLKLGADPYLTAKDLDKLFESARLKNIIEPKAIYIDDMALDTNEWGEGWQWDDDLNPLMPKFSSYNIDSNLLDVVISPTMPNEPAQITMKVFYPTTFMNYATTGNENNIKLSRKNYISPDIITVEGTVKTQVTKKIPVNYPKRYFGMRLENALRNEKIDYYNAIEQRRVPTRDITTIEEIKHPISQAQTAVLKNSNNMVAETVFKLAGGKYTGSSGSIESAVRMFNDYCKNNGLNSADVKIVDGSGVSKNNLMTSDFMTSFLVKLAGQKNFADYKKSLPTSNEGTLTNRMLYFKDNLRAKTGTLADISAITGYLTAKSGKTYAFNIMINDAKSKGSDKKMLEEYILRALYNNY